MITRNHNSLLLFNRNLISIFIILNLLKLYNDFLCVVNLFLLLAANRCLSLKLITLVSLMLWLRHFEVLYLLWVILSHILLWLVMVLMLSSVYLDLAVHLISPLKLKTIWTDIVVNVDALHIVDVNASDSAGAHEWDKALLGLLHGIKERCTWIIVAIIMKRLLLKMIFYWHKLRRRWQRLILFVLLLGWSKINFNWRSFASWGPCLSFYLFVFYRLKLWKNSWDIVLYVFGLLAYSTLDWLF